jgi:hypothetical protein
MQKNELKPDKKLSFVSFSKEPGRKNISSIQLLIINNNNFQNSIGYKNYHILKTYNTCHAKS